MYVLKYCGSAETNIEISKDLHLFALPIEYENAAFGVSSVCMYEYVCLYIYVLACLYVYMCARRWRLKVWMDYIFVR